jgi:hypothetical protein
MGETRVSVQIIHNSLIRDSTICSVWAMAMLRAAGLVRLLNQIFKQGNNVVCDC